VVVAEGLVAAAIRSWRLLALVSVTAGLAAVRRAAARIAGRRAGRDSVDGGGDGGDCGLPCSRIPDGVGVAGHVSGGLVVGGGQVVPHRGGSRSRKSARKIVSSLRAPVGRRANISSISAEGRRSPRSGCLIKANACCHLVCQSLLQSFIGVVGARLNFVDEVAHRNHHRLWQFHQHMVIHGAAGGDVRTAKTSLRLPEPHDGVGSPELRKFDRYG
jgi:hypothetical protein